MKRIVKTRKVKKSLPSKQTATTKTKKENKVPKVEKKHEKATLPDKYVFRNYFESETQLKDITYKSPLEDIVSAYTRLILVYASNHVRDGVELEDLMSEGKRGVIEAHKEFNDKKRKKPNYNFHQACLYKIRSCIFQFCLRNATQIKTPYYIQRGSMHVAQIYKLMSNQSVAEDILGRKGPATEQEIIAFLYDEDERLPKKGIRFIKKHITKKSSKEEFNQILSGILNHELGSRHSYVKNNLTNTAKVLHIKEKIWYTSFSNKMEYKRVMDLILSARQSKIELTPNIFTQQSSNVEKEVLQKELIAHGRKVCGEKNFNVLLYHKIFDKTYDEISVAFSIRKDEILEILKKCIRILRKDPYFQESFNSLA